VTELVVYCFVNSAANFKELEHANKQVL